MVRVGRRLVSTGFALLLVVLGPPPRAVAGPALADGSAGMVLRLNAGSCPNNQDPATFVTAAAGIGQGGFSCRGTIGSSGLPAAFSGTGVADGSAYHFSGEGSAAASGNLTFQKHCEGTTLAWGSAEGDLTFSLSGTGVAIVNGQLLDGLQATVSTPFRIGWVGPLGKGLESGTVTITIKDQHVLRHPRAVIMTAVQFLDPLPRCDVGEIQVIVKLTIFEAI